MKYIDEGIEHLLDSVPHTIEGALQIAIDNGSMTIKEAEECRDAYYAVFDGLEEPLSLPEQWGDRPPLEPGQIGSVPTRFDVV